MGFDYHRLREDTDARDVVEYMGLEYSWKGGRMSILCPDPGHNDTRLGNCFVNKRGYYCFACGAKGDAIKMLSGSLGISYRSAALQIAGMYGGPAVYQTGDQEREDPFPLTKEEEMMLFVNGKTWTPCAYTKDKAEAKKQHFPCRPDADGYIIGTEQYVGARGLFREDPEAFWFMLEGKIDEMLQVLEAIDGSKVYEAFLTPAAAYVFGMENRRKIRTLERLKLRLYPTKGKAG